MIKYAISGISPLFTAETFLYTFFIGLLAILAPLEAIVHTVFVLVIIDNLTGIGAGLRKEYGSICFFCLRSWQFIKSDKLGRSVTKMLAYCLLIISAFLIDQYILKIHDEQYLLHVIAATVAFREIISITENVEQITGASLVTIIINVIRNGVKEGLAASLGKDKEELGNEDKGAE